MATSDSTTNSGIYIIRNIKNGKVYIGQSGDLRRRWVQHRSELRGGYHSNSHLQMSWNKYGEKAFKFLVLEYCPVEMLDVREQRYLNSYVGGGQCYNISTDACSPMRGRKQSPEHIEKRLKSVRGRTITEQQKQQISQANKGRVHSEQSIKLMRQAKIGKKQTPESNRKRSESLKGEKNHNFGKPLREETCRKISETKKRQALEKKQKVDE
jgi:group I intron endonuclease